MGKLAPNALCIEENSLQIGLEFVLLARIHMKILLVYPLLILATLWPETSTHSPSDQQLETLPFLLGGIQVNEPDHQKWVETLQDDGMNTVSVTVYAKQGDWEDDNLWWEEKEESVVAEIRTARKAGLKVVLILRVALDHAYIRNEFFWHGMILPKSDVLLDSWFEKYTRFAKKWAAIAEEEKIDVFAVGSEMNALTSTLPVDELPALYEYYLNRGKQSLYRKRILRYRKTIQDRHLWTPGPNQHATIGEFIKAREFANRFWAAQHSFEGESNRIELINARSERLNKHWENLIQETRKIYHGPHTYAANFDNYHEVGFWKHLDFIGINAYFPLQDSHKKKVRPGASFVRFKERWEEIFSKISAFKTEQQIEDHPVIFTELGYTFRKKCSVEPWSSYGFSVIGNPPLDELVIWQDQPIDYSERAQAVKALYAASSKMGPGQFQGILYWKLTSVKSHIDIEPFVLYLGPESNDPLKAALRRFTE